MRSKLIELKYRIDKNKKEIQRKSVLINPIIEMIDNLLQKNLSDEKIEEWFYSVDNVISSIENTLLIIEQKNNYKKHKL